MVNSIEENFIPIAIYNNTEGDHDAKIRTQFKEPSWNNPVVRILDSNGTGLVPRINNDWSLHRLADSMKEALAKKLTPAPAYLKILAQESLPQSQIETAIFGMT